MQENMYTNTPALKDRVNARLMELKLAGREISKAELGSLSGIGRTTVSNYLNGKNVSASAKKIKEFEAWLENWLAENGEPVSILPQAVDSERKAEQGKPATFKKRVNFETADFNGVTAICTMCHETPDMGVIIGNTGYGKTYALQNYAKLPKVAYIECNDIMNCKDIVRRLERAVGLPKGNGNVDERMLNLSSFLEKNKGYLLIIDEADKLLSKYTTQKIEMIRSIMDLTHYSTGLVLAGEPSLKENLASFDERFANRMGIEYILAGLTRKDIERYFSGYEVEDAAFEELCNRAYKKKTGCFRLLDRTLNNVIRILKISDKNVITYDVLKEASSMMIL